MRQRLSGAKEDKNTDVMIPDAPKNTDLHYIKKKRKRAGIDPVISHCKYDHRMERNFYKGLFGDSINIMLAAAAFNFKRAMRLFLRLIEMVAKGYFSMWRSIAD